ncbi:arylsulfatase A-like enzyme [Microbacterium sp. AG1240]|nr:arylsulfatase A-like enzyme [Microbacterium sp. AG1240]
MTSPNIVWISTHDINPHIGPYSDLWPGAEVPPTPRLDELARQGVRFDQAFAAAPVCAPSRSAIMTGCYPTAIGTMHMRTKAVPPPETRLLAEYFRAAGYYTTNNWFTDFQVETPPTAFDDCSATAHWRDRPEGAPFFAAFHSLITHESRIYGDAMHAEATATLSAEERTDPSEVPVPPYHPDTAATRASWARYYDLVMAMDVWVGGILDQLDEDGLTDETLVVFWSDHGASFPGAKRWASEAGLRVPLLVRWPGKIAPGSHRPEVVQMLDLAPTMMHAAGLSVPAHMHGVPLFSPDGQPLAAAPYAYGARDRMDAQEDTVRTVRDQRYRYTVNIHPDRSAMQYNHYPDHVGTWNELRRLAHEEGEMLSLGHVPALLTDPQRSLVSAGRPAEELYDIADDPHETRNLIDDPAHHPVRERLRGALDAWRSTHPDLGVVPETELLAQWRPGGASRPTSTPVARSDADLVTVACDTPGSSIAWTTSPPVAARERSKLEMQTGAPLPDGRRWHLYTGPFTPPRDAEVWVGAWRLGYAPSAEVRLPSAITTEGS